MREFVKTIIQDLADFAVEIEFHDLPQEAVYECAEQSVRALVGTSHTWERLAPK